MTTRPAPGHGVSASSRPSDAPHRHPAGGNPRPPRAAGRDGPGSLQRILYYLILSILCARPLISESFERVELWFLAPAVRDIGPTPATTVTLDALLLAAAAASFALPARRRRPDAGAARTGPPGAVSAGVLLLAAAAALSTLAAGDKRLAANAGANLVVTVLAGAGLVRLMSARWMVHMLLAAALASGVATATKCILQKSVEFKETAAAWEQLKRELAGRGQPVDSPAIVNYERRLRSADAFGYLYHPNVTASCLLLALIPASGLAGAALKACGTHRWHGLPAAAASLLLCAVLAAGLWLTGSLGGIASAAVGCVLTILLTVFGRRTSPGRLLALLACGYAAILAAIIAVGLSTGRLPHESLAFRWEYWTAALRVYADAPLTGVGRQNFGDGYLLYKSAASTEEVKDPHNLWVSLLVELGPLGLISGILLVGSCLAAAVRGAARSIADPADPRSFTRVDLLAPPVGVLLTVALCSGTPFDPLALGATWAAGFAVAAWVLEVRARDALASRWLSASLAAALAALLLHALIDFALCTPAGLAAFVALAAAAGAPAAQAPGGDDVIASRGRSAAAAGATAMLLAAYALAVAIPTYRTQARVAAMQRAAETAAAAGTAADQVLATAIGGVRAAVSADRWDPHPARAAAETAMRLSGLRHLTVDARETLLDLAVECAREAERRNPRAVSTQNLLASIFELRWNLLGQHGRGQAARNELSQAVAHAERAAGMHPTDPRAHILAGRLVRELWRATGDSARTAQAAAHFRAALRIDALRKPDVAVKLGPQEQAFIEEALREMDAARAP